MRSLAVIAVVVLVAMLSSTLTRAADPVRYEHRVVVATTSLERGFEIADSLERNVNALAALGYEVAAIAAGNPKVVQALLDRSVTDALAQTFVVMARPIGRPAPPREYRLVHSRAKIDLDRKVVKLGEEGFHLTTASFEGETFHGAFERGAPGQYEYLVIAGKFRKGWDAQIKDDPALLARLRRIVPMGDHAMVELGPPSDVPARFEWIVEPVHRFGSDTEAKVQARAKDGYRVNLLRVRLNAIDLLLLRPAGSDGKPVTYDVDYGSWGSACSRGVMAGADVYSDGKLYCAAEDPSGPVSNSSLDATARPESSAGGRVLFRPPDCETRARLTSQRSAATRLAMASQLEREIERKVAPGYRVSRALAASDESGQMRVYVISSSQPAPAAAKTSIAPSDPVFTPDRDLPGEDLLARREAELNQRLRGNTTLGDALVWVEIVDVRASHYVRVAGCASGAQDKAQAESVVRGLLVRTPYSSFALRNDIIVDRWR